jgi:hypothetical protein
LKTWWAASKMAARVAMPFVLRDLPELEFLFCMDMINFTAESSVIFYINITHATKTIVL